MNVVAIVQARRGSARLPGKVLADLGGRTVIERVLERLERCRTLDGVAVATTVDASDDEVANVAARAGARCVRGSVDDVLARYQAAATAVGADVVIRITADCPLLDPTVVDKVVAALIGGGGRCDYASNVIDRRYPRGLDAEALYADVLRRVARLATSPQAREHVTWFILREHPELFVRRSVTPDGNDADLRLTLDTPRDLELIQALYADIAAGRVTDDHRSLVGHVRSDPRLAALSAEPPG